MTEIIMALTWLVVALGLMWGWILNIMWIVNQTPLEMSGETIVSIIGIFVAPLGSIMGLFVH